MTREPFRFADLRHDGPRHFRGRFERAVVGFLSAITFFGFYVPTDCGFVREPAESNAGGPSWLTFLGLRQLTGHRANAGWTEDCKSLTGLELPVDFASSLTLGTARSSFLRAPCCTS